MDKVQEAIKCAKCREVLSVPIILPCGHSICKKHTETDEEQILCEQCFIWHPNKGFFENKALQKIIASHIASMDLGNVHKEAKSSCEKLRDVLDQIDLVLKDPNFCIYEKISGLKNRIILKNEEFKIKLEEVTQKLLNYVEKYDDDCKHYLNTENYKKTSETILQMKKNGGKKLEQCLSTLNELKFNESEWKQIQTETEQKCNEFKQKLNEFKDVLLLHRLKQNESNIIIFENIQVNSIFERL